MNLQERVICKQEAENYLEKNRVFDLLNNLCTELLLERPENSIDFLIQNLSKRVKLQVYILICSDTEKLEYLGKRILKELGISVAKSPEEISKAKIGGGFWILLGRPNNLEECMDLQKSNFIPRRIFFIDPDERKLREDLIGNGISKELVFEKAKSDFLFHYFINEGDLWKLRSIMVRW